MKDTAKNRILSGRSSRWGLMGLAATTALSLLGHRADAATTIDVKPDADGCGVVVAWGSGEFPHTGPNLSESWEGPDGTTFFFRSGVGSEFFGDFYSAEVQGNVAGSGLEILVFLEGDPNTGTGNRSFGPNGSYDLSYSYENVGTGASPVWSGQFTLRAVDCGPPHVAEFKITSVRLTEDGATVALKFNSEAGQTYRVETSPALAAATWADAGVSVEGDGSEQGFDLPTAGLGGAHFFRVTATMAPPTPTGFVLIPGGTFQMGNSFDGEGSYDERPVHTVEVSRFYMQSTEVTNAQMATVMNWARGQGLVTASTTTVRNVNGNQQELLDMNDSDIRLSWSGSEILVAAGYEDHPVVEGTWYGAVAYCQFRSQMDGLMSCYNFSDWSCDFTKSGYRLPTEAEWEKAARLAAAKAGETWRYPFGNSIDSTKANYNYLEIFPNTAGGTKQVGSYPATAGLYDMAGNVSEWCHDYASDSYYSSSPGRDPTGPATGFEPIWRGGAFTMRGADCRVAARLYLFGRDWSSDSVGFRSVRR